MTREEARKVKGPDGIGGGMGGEESGWEVDNEESGLVPIAVVEGFNEGLLDLLLVLLLLLFQLLRLLMMVLLLVELVVLLLTMELLLVVVVLLLVLLLPVVLLLLGGAEIVVRILVVGEGARRQISTNTAVIMTSNKIN